MELAAEAIRGHNSAHSLATGPVIAEPANGAANTHVRLPLHQASWSWSRLGVGGTWAVVRAKMTTPCMHSMTQAKSAACRACQHELPVQTSRCTPMIKEAPCGNGKRIAAASCKPYSVRQCLHPCWMQLAVHKMMTMTYTFHFTLWVYDHSRIVFKVNEDAILSPPRLALPHHHSRNDCTCKMMLQQCTLTVGSPRKHHYRELCQQDCCSAHLSSASQAFLS